MQKYNVGSSFGICRNEIWNVCVTILKKAIKSWFESLCNGSNDIGVVSHILSRAGAPRCNLQLYIVNKEEEEERI